jgi:hypothetical protein
MTLTPLLRRIAFASAREWQARMSRPEGDEALTQKAAQLTAKKWARRAGARSVQSPTHISKTSKRRAEARRAALAQAVEPAEGAAR